MPTWQVFKFVSSGDYGKGSVFQNQNGVQVVFDGEQLVGGPVGIEDVWECIGFQ